MTGLFITTTVVFLLCTFSILYHSYECMMIIMHDLHITKQEFQSFCKATKKPLSLQSIFLFLSFIIPIMNIVVLILLVLSLSISKEDTINEIKKRYKDWLKNSFNGGFDINA